jgi:Fe-Mn family superoxide dismutase
MAFELPKLAYAYDALEPHIDARTMEIHHTKHHQTYITNLNGAVDKTPELAGKSLEAMLGDLNAVPEGVRMVVRNHGGGTYNHNLFWEVMGPNAGGAPKGELAKAIEGPFTSFDAFKAEFEKAATTALVQAWLEKGSGCCCILANQIVHYLTDLPDLVLDVWEHAYYLKYQNRPEYITAF